MVHIILPWFLRCWFLLVLRFFKITEYSRNPFNRVSYRKDTNRWCAPWPILLVYRCHHQCLLISLECVKIHWFSPRGHCRHTSQNCLCCHCRGAPPHIGR